MWMIQSSQVPVDHQYGPLAWITNKAL